MVSVLLVAFFVLIFRLEMNKMVMAINSKMEQVIYIYSCYVIY